MNRLHLILAFSAFLTFHIPAAAEVEIRGNDSLVALAGDILRQEIVYRDISNPVIIGLEADLAFPELAALPATGKEGFKIATVDGKTVIAGHDSRGTLYGAGQFLRNPGISNMSSTPAKKYRVQHIQPSPRATSPLDAWAKERFESYVRDLVLFGMNGIQLLHSISDDYIRIARKYGLDIWIVTYDNGPDYISGEGLKRELDGKRKRYASMSVIDHLVIKSGDPGDLPGDVFMNVSSRDAAILKKIHPGAKVWIAPQHFQDAPMSYFSGICRRVNDAAWVDGVVFGPWCRMTARQLRENIRQDLPIVSFPDITHIYSSQYPARDIDYPMAKSLGRICINPNPDTQKRIYSLFCDIFDGDSPYSEGTQDDVNKVTLLSLGWNPDADVKTVVEEYARLYVPGTDPSAFADGILALEKNLIGPFECSGARQTLKKWMCLEECADKETLSNVRFLMPLLRAYYDAYIYERWTAGLDAERKCNSLLSSLTPKDKSLKQIAKAESLLRACSEVPDKELRKKCISLYEKVFHDSGRWTMEYQKNHLIEQIDGPLVDDTYIFARLEEIKMLRSNSERIGELVSLGKRQNPDNGDLYFNLGDYSTESITHSSENWSSDPGGLTSAHTSFGGPNKSGFIFTGCGFSGTPVPRSWLTQTEMFYDSPLELEFSGLDPSSSYDVEVVYVGIANKSGCHVKLLANGMPVHKPLRLSGDVDGRWKLPDCVSADGKVTLVWTCNPGERGVNVAEVRFIKK